MGAVSEDFATVRVSREEEGWEHREKQADWEHLSWFGYQSQDTQKVHMHLITFPHALWVGGAALVFLWCLRNILVKPEGGFVASPLLSK